MQSIVVPGGIAVAPDTPARRTLFRRLPDWTLTLPAAITLAMMMWGIGAPSYWRDEADTVSAVSRSLPQLMRLLGHVDAVHGTYYLLLWPVTRAFGTGEFVTRLPSALAMTGAALGVAAIARRLRSRRAGLCAGLVFAALPAVSIQGHDARPYAMVTAGAVLASLAFVRALDDPRPRRFAAYGLSLALLGYLHLFALLLIPAHAVTLFGLRRRGNLRDFAIPVARGWFAAVTAACIAVMPLAAIGWVQRAQVAWIPRPGWHAVGSLVASLTVGSAASAVLTGLLAALGGTRGDPPPAGWRVSLGGRAGAAERELTWLAAPWLVLPPVTLLAVSQIEPIYYFLYVVFCLPAVALLAGSGLATMGRPGKSAALALIVALALPTQLAIRVPGSGESIRATAQTLAAYGRPGDAVIYPGSGIPPWYFAYPAGFGPLREIQLAKSGPASGRLYGLQVPPRILAQRERGVCRIWAVEMGPPWPDPGGYLVPGFRLMHWWDPGGGDMRLWLYQRARPGCRARPASPAAREPGAAAGGTGR